MELELFSQKELKMARRFGVKGGVAGHEEEEEVG